MNIQKSQVSANCNYYEEEEIGNADGGYITEPTPAYCLKYKQYIFGRDCENCEEAVYINSI